MSLLDSGRYISRLESLGLFHACQPECKDRMMAGIINVSVGKAFHSHGGISKGLTPRNSIGNRISPKRCPKSNKALLLSSTPYAPACDFVYTRIDIPPNIRLSWDIT